MQSNSEPLIDLTRKEKMATSPSNKSSSNTNANAASNETNVDAEWEKQVREIFAIYDKESNQEISSDDIADAIRSCGVRLTNDQARIQIYIIILLLLLLLFVRFYLFLFLNVFCCLCDIIC